MKNKKVCHNFMCENPFQPESERGFVKCAKCKFEYYCSKKCRKEAWHTHEDICPRHMEMSFWDTIRNREPRCPLIVSRGKHKHPTLYYSNGANELVDKVIAVVFKEHPESFKLACKCKTPFDSIENIGKIKMVTIEAKEVLNQFTIWIAFCCEKHQNKRYNTKEMATICLIENTAVENGAFVIPAKTLESDEEIEWTECINMPENHEMVFISDEKKENCKCGWKHFYITSEEFESESDSL